MGDYWLHNLPDVIRAEGLPVRTWPGWETRARSSGGYDSLSGIVIHHTASQSAPDNDCRFMFDTSSIRPVGAMLLDREGRITIGAAGATNHCGAGGPWGPVPADAGNRHMIGIEAANSGRGEPWPAAQTAHYVRLVAALVKHYGIPLGNVIAHHEWAPTRKIDPWGPSPWGQEKWNMDAFRGSVFAFLEATKPPPPPPPVDGPQLWAQVQPGEGWWSIYRRTHTSPPTNQTVNDLIVANPGVTLQPGEFVRVPGRLP